MTQARKGALVIAFMAGLLALLFCHHPISILFFIIFLYYLLAH